MRGKVRKIRNLLFQIRITPAYAGKSVDRQAVIVRERDHPRLCGEKLSDAVSSLLTLGSPPPMRGKAKVTLAAVLVSRITPAYAGKSCRNR